MVRLIKLATGFIAILLFAESLHASYEQPAIPLHSHLIEVNGHQLHLHQKGRATTAPLLILLSGPTDNWHSDSAWWIVAQNYLAKNFQTIAIDRAGHGWSSRIEEPSYRQFSSDLETLLLRESFIKQERGIVFVAFASSNLSLNLLLQNTDIEQRTKGVVLIDPDVLTKHSIKHYTEETEQYRNGWQGLKDYISSGKYDERIKEKIRDERKHLEKLLSSETRKLMDWDYYDAVESIRATRDYQLHKFLEASVYKDDLEAAKNKGLVSSVPLVILDTDFESAYLERLEDNNIKASIAQWRADGIEWYFNLAEASNCGAYWPVDTREHLLMMTQPELIEQAIEKVLACST